LPTIQNNSFWGAYRGALEIKNRVIIENTVFFWTGRKKYGLKAARRAPQFSKR